MNKMFAKGTELMSAEEIVIAHGENEMLTVTAKEFADLEKAKAELSAIKQRAEEYAKDYQLTSEEIYCINYIIKGETK